MIEKLRPKILIAGSSGVIGKKVYNRFFDRYKLINIGFSNNLEQKNYQSIDLSKRKEANTFASKCSKIDVLLFFVGLAHKKGKTSDYDQFYKYNYLTLVNLIESLNQNNNLPDKIIFASTISVYGEKYNINQYNEEITPNPSSPYARTKVLAENYLKKNFLNQTWILRFAPVYYEEFLLNIERRVKVGNLFYKIGKGNQILSLCSIYNIIDTIELIINENIKSDTYNLSDKKFYSYNDLLLYENAKNILRIPRIFIKILFLLGKISKNIFFIENTIKLLTSNVYPSNKLQKYIDLKHGLYNNSDY